MFIGGLVSNIFHRIFLYALKYPLNFAKKNHSKLDSSLIVKTLTKGGRCTIQEGNGRFLTFLYVNEWHEEVGYDWVFVLYDIFQIRSVADQFSEVSLDIVEFASKPTIYHSPASSLLPLGLAKNGIIRFALIRDKAWNGLLFQANKLLMVRMDDEKNLVDFKVKELFPLFSPNLKELFLSPEGDVKIIKG